MKHLIVSIGLLKKPFKVYIDPLYAIFPIILNLLFNRGQWDISLLDNLPICFYHLQLHEDLLVAQFLIFLL